MHFFGRDTGLLCRGLEMAGVESCVIMPGQRSEEDDPALVRCDLEDLSSVDWWKRQGLDAVVLYAWGDPRYLAIATAIREAGVFLIQSLDNAGMYTPYSDLSNWWRIRAGMIMVPQKLEGRLKSILRVFVDLCPFIYDRKRTEMLRVSDRIGVVSPGALEVTSGFLKTHGDGGLADSIMLLPHSVRPRFIYRGEKKEKRVLVVGRWTREDHSQKNPQATLQAIRVLLQSRPDWSAEIVGRDAETLRSFTGSWTDEESSRVTLTGNLTHEELEARYGAAMIHLCGSRHESFHIASAEAVCSGCSVVVGDHPLLVSTGWFVSENSGTLASSRRGADLGLALIEEASNWEDGKRDPQSISESWCQRVHADKVAGKIVEIVGSACGESGGTDEVAEGEKQILKNH
jgi:glycosyltransferase involved in cell wall biosynthesis